MAQRLDAGIAAWADDVGLLARFQAFERQPPDPVTARRLLEDLRSRSPTFSWIGFTDADGRVIAATGGLLEGVTCPHAPGSARPSQGSISETSTLPSSSRSCCRGIVRPAKPWLGGRGGAGPRIGPGDALAVRPTGLVSAHWGLPCWVG
jgi:hypothetical protein